MNALIQRGVALLLTAGALAAALWGHQQAAWLGAVLGLLAVAAIVPAVLAFECAVLLPLVNRSDPTPKPTLAQRITSWWRECLTAYRVFGWWQPFCTQREADHLHTGYRGQRAVVLIHGFFCNRALWNHWMPRLRAQKVPFIAITMEPAFGAIDDYVTQVDDAIERAWQATGTAPLLVGHSMGGLAIRAWRRWRNAHAGDSDTRFVHALTIGTPHHGTATARYSHAVNAQQMRLNSAWLQQLAASESTARNARLTCYYSHCDNIVMPAASATLPGARHVHLPGWAHVELVFAPSIFGEVLHRASSSADAAQSDTVSATTMPA
jgi:triacylglycerol lipase